MKKWMNAGTDVLIRLLRIGTEGMKTMIDWNFLNKASFFTKKTTVAYDISFIYLI